MAHSSQGINLAALMELMQTAVIAEIVSIHKNLWKHFESTALLTGFKNAVGLDRDDGVGNPLPFEQLACTVAKGTARKNRELNPFLGGWSSLCCCCTQPEQQLYALVDGCSCFEMPAPNLTGTIGKTEMEVHTLWRHRAVQRDHFKNAVHPRGMGLARALKAGFRKIADHTENESAALVIGGELVEGLVKILTGFQLEGQSLHASPKRAATE